MDNTHILALSWNIQTEPKLYWELVPNPYTASALQTISQRFPGEHTADVIRAVILAEPESSDSEKIPTVQMQKRLTDFCREYRKELKRLPKEYAYDYLSRTVFETTDAKKIVHMYPQEQRRSIRTSIIDCIEQEYRSVKSRTWIPAFFAGLFIIPLLIGVWVRYLPKKPLLPSVQAKEQELAITLPVRLKIPSIHVDAAIQHVGLGSDGSMDVPNNTIDVGWFNLGAVPGNKGNAVIAGHFNGKDGLASVFADLNKLIEGDRIYVEDTNGTMIEFVVRSSRTYDPGFADEVFSQSDAAHLNLITCDGVWDETKESYTKRLVIFADIMH